MEEKKMQYPPWQRYSWACIIQASHKGRVINMICASTPPSPSTFPVSLFCLIWFTGAPSDFAFLSVIALFLFVLLHSQILLVHTYSLFLGLCIP